MNLQSQPQPDIKSRLFISSILSFLLAIFFTSCGNQKKEVIETYKSAMRQFNDSSVIVFDKVISDLRENSRDHQSKSRAMGIVQSFELQLNKKIEDFQKKANDSDLSIEEFGLINREVLDKTMQPAMQKYSVLKLTTMQADIK